MRMIQDIKTRKLKGLLGVHIPLMINRKSKWGQLPNQLKLAHSVSHSINLR